MKRSLLCVYFGFVAMNALATRAAENHRTIRLARLAAVQASVPSIDHAAPFARRRGESW